MIRILASLIFALATRVPAQAPPTISTRILTYAPAGLPDGMTACFRNGKELELFRASAGTLGLPLLYTGPDPLILYPGKEDFIPNPGGGPPPAPLAAIDLPDDADMILILCTRSETDKVAFAAYDISSGNLKSGEYLIFNFSRSSVSLVLGEQRVGLRPRGHTTVRDGKWRDETLALPLKIAILENEKPKLVYSNFWEHYPQRRNLMFLFNGRHPSQPVTFVAFNAEPPPPATHASP